MPELFFKGKEYVYNHHLTVPYRPLIAQPEKSIGPADLAGNLIIHGDNLHALKSLLPRYAGKVDLIFIDPPYNTGNENWSYNDNVNSPIMREWLKSNPVNSEDMLRHDKWLCMMWPRLTLLRELLSERGVMAVFIGNDELHQLRAILDEVFGADKFVACLVWKSRAKPSNTGQAQVKPQMDAEFVLLYGSGDGSRFNKVVSGESRSYPHSDSDGTYRLQTILKSNRGENARESMRFPIAGYTPPPEQRWQGGEEFITKLYKKNCLEFKDGTPFRKCYEHEEDDEHRPFYCFVNRDLSGTSEGGKSLLNQILGNQHGFDTVKPIEMVDYLMTHMAKENSLVLDSFAGSGTAAHAVLKANNKDGGRRTFILVEGEDYADRITAERVRRVIGGYAYVGTRREELLREKVTWSKLQKSAALLEQVDTIRQREGFAERPDLAQMPADKRRFDKVNVKINDGVLQVEGEKKISERVDGLGGEFTFCTLGAPIDAEKILAGKQLPDYASLAAWLFYTATGGTLAKSTIKEKDFFLGEAQDRYVWLIYKPDLGFLKSPDAALTLSFARKLREKHSDQRHLVFAPAKFLSNKQLLEFGVEFAPLPFALYREA